MDEQKLAMNRRRFIVGLSAAGVGSTLMPGALAAVAQDADKITVEMLKAAQRIAGLRLHPGRAAGGRGSAQPFGWQHV